MRVRQAFSLAVIAAALAIFGTHAGAQLSDGPLLQPGEPYPGAEEAKIQLIPPDELKKRKAAAAKKEQPAAAAPAPSAAPPAATTYTAPQFDPGIQSAVTTVQDTIAVPARSQPAEGAALSGDTAAPSRVPLALSPTSPDVIIGPRAQPQYDIYPLPRNPAPGATRKKSRSQTPAFAVTPGAVAPPAKSAAEPIAASLTPVPRAGTSDARRGLSKRSEIVFSEGAVDPTPDTIADLRRLAGDLNAALRGTGRVQLEAFGGSPGDKSSDARRLSLKRALAVRALLIESGVPAERIDVRALGGITDGGTPDRVDVFLRSS